MACTGRESSAKWIWSNSYNSSWLKERAFDLINTLTIPKIVSNIGDTKTLIIHPESTLNAHSTQKKKEEAGVFDDLIRISVGIEDVEDLIEDFKHALK